MTTSSLRLASAGASGLLLGWMRSSKSSSTHRDGLHALAGAPVVLSISAILAGVGTRTGQSGGAASAARSGSVWDPCAGG